jgi:ferredoxin--NADP+ reductase
VQSSFTTPELRELGDLDDVDVVVDPRDLELDETSAAHLASAGDRNAEKNVEVLREWAGREGTGAARRIVFHFGVSPVALLGTERVEGVRIVHNALEPDGRGGVRAVPSGRTEEIPVQLVFRSVGYRGVEIPGLPFDDAQGLLPNAEGRVVEHVGSHTPLDGVYVCGWIKRGPSGVIGTNKVCATQTVDHLLADVVAGRVRPAEGEPDGLLATLGARGARVITWPGWQRIDAAEVARGQGAGKPREKLTRIPDLLDAAD